MFRILSEFSLVLAHRLLTNPPSGFRAVEGASFPFLSDDRV